MLAIAVALLEKVIERRGKELVAIEKFLPPVGDEDRAAIDLDAQSLYEIR